MRVVLALNGTRGDVQPAVVLGVELAGRGHEVVVGAPPNLAGFVEGAGLAVRSFGYDTRAHMNSDLVRDGLRKGGPRARLRALTEIRDRGWQQMVDEMFDLCATADIIVTGFTTQQIAFAFAQRDSVPLVVLHHAPIADNPLISPFPGAPLSLPPWVNTLSWRLVDRLFWILTRRRENRLRALLGLGPVRGVLSRRMAAAGVTEVQAYDPVFCPGLEDAWDNRRPLVGFVDLPGELRSRIGTEVPDPATDHWIAGGPAPIYFGFGSMPVRDTAGVLTAIETACRRLGQRALICAGWSDLGLGESEAGSIDPRRSDMIRIVESVDHRRVFTRCRAVVHHGGAGTTSEVIRAGKPSVVCWVGSDQPFWGLQLERLGVGVSTRLKGITAETLEARLRTVMAPGYTQRSQDLATRLIPAEQATAAAVDVIERAAHRRSSESVG
ncbi:glycosyltransferase [Williamsia sp.]|uniref:glycosyltransferase n=1 Tax=Williamsia sp. TaxID=1872085 RepID=UPI002F92C51D